MNRPGAIEISGHNVFDVGPGDGGGPYYSEVVDFMFRRKVVFTRYEKGIAPSTGVIYVASCHDVSAVLDRMLDMFHWEKYFVEKVVYYTKEDVIEEQLRASQ